MDVHPAFGVPVHARVELLSENSDIATARTIERMRAIVDEDRRHSSIIRLARELCGGRPGVECVEAVHRWVRDRVVFVQDSELAAPLGFVEPGLAEVLVRPVHLLRMPQPMGDCDDFSMLAAAILRAAGIDVSFATVGADKDSPDRYSHVYVVAHLPEGDVPVDASHGRYAGWEAPNLYGKFREWGLSGMQGLGLVSTGATPDWLSALITGGFDFGKTLLAPPSYQSGPGGTTIRTAGQSTFPSASTLPGPASGGAFGADVVPGVSNSMLLLGGLALLAVILVAKK